MTQTLLLPDPRPLVERLGADFFRTIPESPGVYLMRDAAGEVLYVGKAKNLRNRVRSYRVANPDRMPRRHLRLLRTAVTIEFQQCVDETSALRAESELLLRLRPRFNRAGTWPETPRFLLWRFVEQQIEMSIGRDPEEKWHSYGPLGAGAFFLRAALARLLWPLLHPDLGLAGMPAGWFSGVQTKTISIRNGSNVSQEMHEIEVRLVSLFAGHLDEFAAWIRSHFPVQDHLFETAARQADLENLSQFLKPKPPWRFAARLLGKPEPGPKSGSSWPLQQRTVSQMSFEEDYDPKCDARLQAWRG